MTSNQKILVKPQYIQYKIQILFKTIYKFKIMCLA